MNSEPFSLKKIAIPAFGPSFLFGLGEGAILPVVPLGARDLGGSVSQAALIVTLIGIGSLACNVPASLITARYGERRAIVGAAVWCALAILLCVLAPNLAVYAAGIFMVGMSAAVFNLARQSYLTEAVPIEFRARALSTLGGSMRVGMFAGPFVAAGLIHAIGVSGAYVAGIVSMLLAGALALTMADLPHLAHSRARGAETSVAAIARSHAKVLATIGVGIMLVSAVRASRQAVIPLWAEHIGLDAATTSLIYGLSGAVDMLVFYPAGRMMDRKGRRWVAVPSMAIMGTALLWMPFTAGATTLMLAALLVGFGNGLSSGLVMTLGADHSPAQGRPQFLGIWRLLSDIGATIGPALVSAVTAAVSLALGVGTAGLLAFAGCAVLGRWIPRGRLVGARSRT